MSKKTIYLLGLLTLLGFPLFSFILAFLINKPIGVEVFIFQEIEISKIILGCIFGFLYAKIGLFLAENNAIKEQVEQQKRMLANLNLSFLDKVFLSFCAGFGEEILFRVFIQEYLGVILTSILFIAVHGYFNFKNPKQSLYGIFLIPFILIIAFGYNYLGFWFAVAIHFAYDLLIFMKIETNEELDSPFFQKRA